MTQDERLRKMLNACENQFKGLNMVKTNDNKNAERDTENYQG